MASNGAEGPQLVIKYKTTWSLLNSWHHITYYKASVLPVPVKQNKPITSWEKKRRNSQLNLIVLISAEIERIIKNQIGKSLHVSRNVIGQ